MPTEQKPKPITLGIFESLEYMNNGVVPRRTCRACAVLGGIFGYIVGMGTILLLIVMVPRIVLLIKGLA